MDRGAWWTTVQGAVSVGHDSDWTSATGEDHESGQAPALEWESCYASVSVSALSIPSVHQSILHPPTHCSATSLLLGSQPSLFHPSRFPIIFPTKPSGLPSLSCLPTFLFLPSFPVSNNVSNNHPSVYPLIYGNHPRLIEGLWANHLSIEIQR